VNTLLVPVLGSILVAGCSAFAQDTSGEPVARILARIDGGQLDRSLMFELEKQGPDPRFLAALKAAFERRSSKDEKQILAVRLLRLGEKSEEYFDYVAQFARQAIDDKTPEAFQPDQSGHIVRGEFAAEFLNWCAQNGRDPKDVAAIQYGVYPNDMLLLAEAYDRRAVELFRRGLETNQTQVILYSVQGLGRLTEVSALPAIEKTLERLGADPARAVAAELPWFSNLEAERIMERFEPNPKMRDFNRQIVRKWQARDLDVASRRLGVQTAPK
jgi:hypothetical protein